MGSRVFKKNNHRMVNNTPVYHNIIRCKQNEGNMISGLVFVKIHTHMNQNKYEVVQTQHRRSMKRPMNSKRSLYNQSNWVK